MKEPRWVPRVVVEAVHLDQVREYGGMHGLRDENALEAALARPRQKWHYEPSTDLAALAAAHAYAMATLHPFNDGNKRMAFLTMVMFLELNGVSFEASEEEVVVMMVGLAAGRINEKELTEWIAR